MEKHFILNTEPKLLIIDKFRSESQVEAAVLFSKENNGVIESSGHKFKFISFLTNIDETLADKLISNKSGCIDGCMSSIEKLSYEIGASGFITENPIGEFPEYDQNKSEDYNEGVLDAYNEWDSILLSKQTLVYQQILE